MKKIIFLTLIGFILTSCGTYHYYPPPVANTFYAGRGETHVSGLVGLSGFTAKGGVAITDKFSVSGMYGGFNPVKGYHVREGEAGIGYGFGKGLKFNVGAGYGLGSNFNQDSGAVYRNFSGNFSRPYAQIGLGTAHTNDKGIKGDVAFILKFNYMSYNGYQSIIENKQIIRKSFTPENFFYEIYLNSSIGGKHVRFESAMGFAFKNIGEIGEGIKVFPMHFNVGIYFIFGRKYE